MPRYVIEREIPGAGSMTAEQLRDASKKSCEALRMVGDGAQWIQSFVADDKIYCIYNASSEEPIRRHAEESGFPANRISRVRSVIDPTTAEG